MHRGPDRVPRVNVAAGVRMKALMKAGPVLVLERTRKGKIRLVVKKGTDVPASMIENLALRLHVIPLIGSHADVLRLIALAHQIFRASPRRGAGSPTSGRRYRSTRSNDQEGSA